MEHTDGFSSTRCDTPQHICAKYVLVGYTASYPVFFVGPRSLAISLTLEVPNPHRLAEIMLSNGEIMRSYQWRLWKGGNYFKSPKWIPSSSARLTPHTFKGLKKLFLLYFFHLIIKFLCNKPFMINHNSQFPKELELPVKHESRFFSQAFSRFFFFSCQLPPKKR